MAITDRIISWHSLAGANDSHTGGHTLTAVNGPTHTTGKVGDAAEFDVTAQSGYIIANASASAYQIGTKSRSVAFWVNISTLPSSGNAGALVMMGGTGTTDAGFHVTFLNSGGSGVFRAGFSDGTSYYIASTSAIYTTGTWYHIAVTWDRNGFMRLYINGVQQAATSIAASAASNVSSDDDLKIGGRYATSVWLDGLIDEVLVWDGVMSSDIRAIHRNGTTGISYADFTAITRPFVAEEFIHEQESNTTHAEVTVPTLLEGQVAVAILATDGNITSPTPSTYDGSWTRHINGGTPNGGSQLVRANGWWKVLTATDESTETEFRVDWTSNEKAVLIFQLWENCVGVNAAGETDLAAAAASITEAGVTTTIAGCRIVTGVAIDGGTTVTAADPPVAFNEYQVTNSAGHVGLWVGSEDQATAGATGTYEFTQSASAASVAFTYAMEPFYQGVSPSSISSGEAFGTTDVSVDAGLSIIPSGITTGEVIGDAVITIGAVSVSPSSIDSIESFGSLTISTGAVDIAPSGVASSESFGSHVLSISVEPTSIASAEAFGDHVITTGSVSISPGGIASLETFGDHVLTTGAVTVSPSGIASLEAFGTLLITLAVSPSAIGSDETFGSHTVAVGGAPQSVEPGSIASDEAFGTAVLTPAISPEGVASSEAFGTPFFTLAITLTGITSAEAFGTPIFVPVLVPPGIASAEAVGSLTVTSTVGIAPSFIASLEAFGTPSFVERIIPTGIPTSETFGTPSLGGVIALTSITSAESFGTPFVGHINPVGIASAGVFGVFKVTVYVSPVGVSSGEAFGTPILLPFIAPAGIASAEAFGTHVVLSAAPITPTGISSAEAFGTPTIVPELSIRPTGISSAENIPRPVVADAAALIAWVNEDLTASVGQTNFNIAINVPNTSPKNILGFLIDISYDTTLLTISGHSTTGTLTASGWTVISSFPSPGIVRVVGAAATPLVGSGVLVNLVVASANAPGSSNLNFSQVLWNEGTPSSVADGGDILISTTGITVPFINGGETFGTPTVTTSSVAIAPVGIASAGVVSEPTVSRGLLLRLTGIPSAEAFGVVAFGNNGLVIPSVQAGEQFGTPSVSLRFPLTEPIRVIIVTENRDYAISIETNNKKYTATLTRNLT